MEQLLQNIMQKTGLSGDKAREVVGTVIAHLKGRLPESLASRLESALGSSTETGGGMAERAKSAAAGSGGIFGKKDE